jgi:predicted amidohydrolase YtcJ
LIPRYQEIGIVPLLFGAYPTCFLVRGTSEYKYTIPEAYKTWEWPWRDLLDENPEVHFAWHGDDPPIPPIDPFYELYGFVTRRDVGAEGSICEPPDWMAAQTISMEEALRLMTIEAAYALFREDEVGSLEAGKFADMIVLSGDPSTAPPNDSKDVEVWMTMIGGEVEFCS